MELADINAKLANVLKALLNGFDDIPELHDEMDKLRIRKSELEDIIGQRQARRTEVNAKDIERLFKNSVERMDSDLPRVLKEHISKIYAHTDGTFSINVGVHLNGCGGRT